MRPLDANSHFGLFDFRMAELELALAPGGIFTAEGTSEGFFAQFSVDRLAIH